MSSLETSTIIGLGTFVVITIAAIAAVVQLRHLRRANELQGLLSVLGRVEDLDFQTWEDESRRLVAERLSDPAYRRSIVEGTFERAGNPWLLLANSYEWLGVLLRRGLIPDGPVLEIYFGRIINAWEMLEPISALFRRRPGGQVLWENFEYLYVRAKRFEKRHRSFYPHDTPRVDLKDAWAKADGVTKTTD